MTNRKAPYVHSDGSNCWTKNCSLGHVSPMNMADKIRTKINALFEAPPTAFATVPEKQFTQSAAIPPAAILPVPEPVQPAPVEKTYKDYGFRQINRDNYLSNRPKGDFKASMRTSIAQFDSLTPVESQAVQLYTYDNHYKWINDALYTKNIAVAPDGPHKTVFPYSWDKEESPVTYPGYQNAGTLKEVCNVLDSAIKKAPAEQKTVYRSVTADNGMFNGLTPSEYLEKNIQAGKEIKFDGYLSSTLDPEVALKHGNRVDGVLFEIRTTEGLNISMPSSYQEEQEVLLPRNTTYKVVGVHKKVRRHEGTWLTTNVVQLVPVNAKS